MKDILPSDVVILIAHLNTPNYLAHLVYSIYDKLGSNSFRSILVVDSNSSKPSKELLDGLQKGGFANMLYLKKTERHGTTLNAGMKHLGDVKAVLVLDSDTVIIKSNLIESMLREMNFDPGVAAVGHLGYSNKEMAKEGGYAHISCLLVRKAIYDNPQIVPFGPEGPPAFNFHKSTRKHGWKIADFPLRSTCHIAHRGHGSTGGEPHFHNSKKMKRLYDESSAAFRKICPNLKPGVYFEVLRLLRQRGRK